MSATKTRLPLRKDIAELYELEGRGAFQKAINNIIFTIFAEIAELETVRLSQRIKSRMDEARRKGKVMRRPRAPLIASGKS